MVNNVDLTPEQPQRKREPTTSRSTRGVAESAATTRGLFRRLLARGLFLVAIGSWLDRPLIAEGGEPSPPARIRQVCDGSPPKAATPPDPAHGKPAVPADPGTGWASYWEAQKGAEPNITIFVTNSSVCDMTMKISSVGTDTSGKLIPPVVIPIKPGQTKSGTTKKASKLEIQCLVEEHSTHTVYCEGTYQLW